MASNCSHRPFPWLLTLVLALLAAAPLAAVSADVVAETGFINGTAELNGRKMPYVVYVPRSYAPDKQWPVILFMHGAGEQGTDGLRQTAVGIGPHIIWNSRRFPCLVVMPQTSSGTWTGTSGDLALRALDDVVAKYNGDRSRLYLTGLSLGGNGTWALAAKYPERFAALIPICGWGSPAAMAPKLKSLPIWVFHGDRDSVVSVKSSRDMVAAIQAAGNVNIKYTEYPGADHDVWDRTYNNQQVIAWLLAQKR
jgi:predicted peptidase